MPPRQNLKEPQGTLSGEPRAHGMGDAGARLKPGEYRLSLWFCKGNDLILVKRRPSLSLQVPDARHRKTNSPRQASALLTTPSFPAPGSASLPQALARIGLYRACTLAHRDKAESHSAVTVAPVTLDFRGWHSRSALPRASILRGHITALQDANV